MTKIFEFTVNDFDVDNHCDRDSNQDHESTTSTTTSATIYNFTTTVVGDITCTTNRSTIKEDVDVDIECDHEHNQVHTNKHLNYDNNADNDVPPDCLIYTVSFDPFVFLFPASWGCHITVSPSSTSIVRCQLEAFPLPYWVAC